MNRCQAHWQNKVVQCWFESEQQQHIARGVLQHHCADVSKLCIRACAVYSRHAGMQESWSIKVKYRNYAVGSHTQLIVK